MSLRPRVNGDKPYAALASTAAIGPGIAAVELLDVEFGRREGAARAGLRAFRTQVAFVCGIAGPFTQPTPNAFCHPVRPTSENRQAEACPTSLDAAAEAAQEAGGGVYGAFHQSSPRAAPVNAPAPRLPMSGG